MTPAYLDCNATTPLEPEVQKVLVDCLTHGFGNEGSRTHDYGARAKQAVQKARDQVAAVVAARRDEVIFTSGATESNNLALLGLAEDLWEQGRRHIITTAIEHKAVLEPIEVLRQRGFEVTQLDSGPEGRITPHDLQSALRPDTGLVSIMHVNNETGVRQPLQAVAECLADHPAWLHTDAAQGFGKDLEPLRNRRFDLISISGHKIYAPQGVGALIVRRRGYTRPPLKALVHGGGQERDLRPGTLPVALIVALGKAAEVAVRDHDARLQRCKAIREQILAALAPLKPVFSGNDEHTMDHVLNLRFPGLDSEALMLTLKSQIAISNGSACTSTSYTPSHVLLAMGLSEQEAQEAVRLSWCHLTPNIDWPTIQEILRKIR